MVAFIDDTYSGNEAMTEKLSYKFSCFGENTGLVVLIKN
jgi:hypothetical protein